MRTLFKKIFCFIFFYSWIELLLSKLMPAGKVTIIMFHAVGINPILSKFPSYYNFYTSRKAFEDKIRFFKDRYNFISFSQLKEFYKENKIPNNSLILTFDDGYCHKEALEILKKYNIPCCIFLTTDFINSNRILPLNELYFCIMQTKQKSLDLEMTVTGEVKRFDLSNARKRIKVVTILNKILKQIPEKEKEKLIKQIIDKSNVKYINQDETGFKMLTWDEIREMKKSGLVEFGSHTKTHCILSNTDDNEAFQQIKESKDKIETELGEKISIFAYPNDDFNQKHIEMLKQCNYTFACTVKYGFNNSQTEPFRLKRIGSSLPNYVLACKILLHSKIKKFY